MPGDKPTHATQALSALSALGQATRLEIFQRLMRHEPDGLSAGTISRALGCPPNTLSSHLAILARAGLVLSRRAGRSIIYRADVGGLRALLTFLANDCCDGRPELCALPPKKTAKTQAIRNTGCCGRAK